MDRLWTPWRYEYIKGAAEQKSPAGDTCVLCHIRDNAADDERNFVLLRAPLNFVILNLYPYTNGHLMVVPYEHVADLDAVAKETTDEMMDLAKRAQGALRAAYRPHGFNFGMNLGQSAGAGIAGHIHLHALPRWTGDANFMTAVGETRVLPEDLPTTYQRLKALF
ncbi:MAG TPA: HIT domain-containing protein [Pyrinomonadaceae bacterium]|nr:HIT domain-containing protein [Pyrinomonadaceae bacterium]